MKKVIKSQLKQLYRNILKFLPTKLVLNIENLRGYHKLINLKNPKYFGEKIQCLKIYGNLERYEEYVDKYKVREIVKKKIGSKYLIPLLEVYDDPEDINYEKLPNSFVIKLNTGSGYNIIVENKNEVNKKNIIKTLKKWLKEDYYKIKKENQYKGIKKKILIEQYIKNENNDLQDFKFYCFDGKIEFIEVDFNRFSNHTMNFYDENWNLLKLEKGKYKNYNEEFRKPKNFNEMKNVVMKLAKEFQFARIDFYNVDGKIYFGEVTLTPAGGLTPFKPIKKDIEYANKIKIQNNKNKKILYIGRISKKRNILDGVTIKARTLKDALEKGKNTIYTIDVDNWKKEILKLSIKIIIQYIKCDEVVICTSSPGAFKVLRFFKFINSKKRIYYFVSGGSLYKKIEDKVYSIELYKNLYRIYVESEFMKEKFISYGLIQTEVKYNFRNPLIKFDKIKKTEDKIKFIFYSRVVKDKGVEHAIRLIKRLSKGHYNVELYIYGQAKKEYLDFLDIKQYDNIYYMGAIQPNSIDEYKIMHNYDIFVFPTEHDGEGLPGALIDAYISGLCVVASNWKYASEYIYNKRSGIIFNYKDYNDMYDKVLELLNNREQIDYYKKNALKEAKKYIIKNIIPRELVGDEFE